jgi:inosine/xanthosine triphosphatase
MKSVVIASKNPVKVRAVQVGFTRMFPDQEMEYLTLSADSGVSNQPDTDEETLQGAYNRSADAMTKIPQADFWVGIEGGVEDFGEEMTAFAWIVVRSRHILGKGRTGVFFLPHPVVKLIKQGLELGEADDLVFGRSNSKQENGAIGLLTGNVIDRAQLYAQAVILALVPFKNVELYSKETEEIN